MHMSQIAEQKCPACGAPLRFDPASGKLVCDYCGTVVDLQQEAEKPVQGSLEEICASNVSLKEKISLLNRFAGGFYFNNELTEAERYLKQALTYDEQDEMSIRNMAVLQMALGNAEKAQAAAAKLVMTDFVLLSRLKEME
jgi:uncharacterized Zn finger protein (UPF0148 family)